MNASVYDTLVRHRKYIPVRYPVVEYLLFSLSGFKDMEAYEKQDHIRFCTPEDLYQE